MKTEKNILIAFLLNIFFSIAEFFGGLFTNSIAILSDSLHDFGDAFSIGLSYFLEKKSKRKPDANHTYGYIRYSVMGSIITTVILLVGSVLVIKEAVTRLINPTLINYDGMLVIAIFGFIINFLATYFTKDGKSLNQKAVNLHMLEDVLGWLIVLIGSILIKLTNLTIIDPILSLIVALFIFIAACKNIKTILDLFLEKTPKDINLEHIKKEILKTKGVLGIHHIHIRSIDGFNNYATMHVIVKKYSKELKQQIKDTLKHQNIVHSTIEFELEDEHCADQNCLN